MAEILIIDDDKQMNEALAMVVEDLGYSVSSEYTLKKGVQRVLAGEFDVVFLDVRLPDGNGLEALPAVRAAASAPEVIIVTAYGNNDGPELAIKNGAWDYIKKPASIEEMTLPLVRALQYRELKNNRVAISLKREKIVGNSGRIKDTLDLIAQVSSNSVNVLITGETGTGKELFARTIHDNSDRANNDFVVVDCTSLPETLVESILFGHVKGAFTGADSNKTGLVEKADGGTLFLDEIAELPLSLQKNFLRVLQERRFLPVGAKHEKESHFRLIAATNKNLDNMVKNGEFREDFLFRINSFPIELPPLRERAEDIKELVYHYSKSFCEQNSIKTKGFTPEFIEAMTLYEWPGNIRELINTIDRVIAASPDGSTLFHYQLPGPIRLKLMQSAGETNNEPIYNETPSNYLDSIGPESFPPLKEYKDSQEKLYLQKLLSVLNNDKNEACRISGLSRSRFYGLMKKYFI